MAPINLHLWSRFVTITRPVLRSEIRWRFLGKLSLLIVLLLSLSGLNVVNSYVGRDFMTAITERTVGRYAQLALLYVCIFAALTVVAACYRFTEERLGLLWRDWLTRHLIDRYLSGHAYFRINAQADLDNPDQRIAEDVRTFSTTTLSFVLMLLNGTITIFAFSGVLWSITPWLFLVAVLYALLGSLLTIFLGRRLVSLDNLQLKREADFRFELVRLRQHAESISVLHGEQKQNACLRQRLNAVVDNFKDIIHINRNLSFFSNGYNYLTQIIPALIVAPLYVRGDVEFGSVTQAAMAFAHVLNAFSLLIMQFERISAFAAVVGRLGSIWEGIEKASTTGSLAIEVVENDSRLAYEELTLRTPSEDGVLLHELSVEVSRWRRLLVVGLNGMGKSALFRATAGIWESGEGRILRPGGDGMMFLPRRPYMACGSLRTELLDGVSGSDPTDDQVLAVLEKMKLETVLTRVGGLDVEADWSNILSLGEQQLLAFARLLLAKPRFAFLDDALGAIDPGRAQELYRMLSGTATAYITVEDHPTLQAYHDQLLEVQDDGGWRLKHPGSRADVPNHSVDTLPAWKRLLPVDPTIFGNGARYHGRAVPG